MLPSFDISSTIVAANLLLRAPIYQSPSFPNGRVQWYLGGGVGAEMADLDVSGVGSEETPHLFFRHLRAVKHS
jgi:hypothetical protein